MQWGDYVLTQTRENSQETWQAAGSTGDRSLLICGGGFDPRTLNAPPFVAAVLTEVKSVLALSSPVQGHHEQAAALAESNRQQLSELFGDSIQFVPAPDAADPRSVGTLFARVLVEQHHVLQFDHVLVDLSGLPSSISFPIIELFLGQARTGGFEGDLQIIVSENPAIDARIVPTGLDQPGTLGGFKRIPEGTKPKIWVPLLGEGAAEELRRLREYLSPDEVCPVLPFPSSDPRRADNLLMEYRTLLFDELAFEPGNVIYASESNPFDLYRQIVGLSERYQRALQPMGGATIVVSEHTSKLLSLAAVLVGHECDVVIADVLPTGYTLDTSQVQFGPALQAEIYTAWLTGKPYRTKV